MDGFPEDMPVKDIVRLLSSVGFSSPPSWLRPFHVLSLIAYRGKFGVGPHAAATLADVIWLDAKWVAAQGAGAAASRVLKRLGCYWASRSNPERWGWILSFPSEVANQGKR